MREVESGVLVEGGRLFAQSVLHRRLRLAPGLDSKTFPD